MLRPALQDCVRARFIRYSSCADQLRNGMNNKRHPDELCVVSVTTGGLEWRLGLGKGCERKSPVCAKERELCRNSTHFACNQQVSVETVLSRHLGKGAASGNGASRGYKKTNVRVVMCGAVPAPPTVFLHGHARDRPVTSGCVLPQVQVQVPYLNLTLNLNCRDGKIT